MSIFLHMFVSCWMVCTIACVFVGDVPSKRSSFDEALACIIVGFFWWLVLIILVLESVDRLRSRWSK